MTQPIHPLLERVARAIAAGQCRGPDYPDTTWAYWLPEARAAVQALMEPDEEQHQIGAQMMRAFAMLNPASQVGASASLVYRAMLRLLVEGEGE